MKLYKPRGGDTHILREFWWRYVTGFAKPYRKSFGPKYVNLLLKFGPNSKIDTISILQYIWSHDMVYLHLLIIQTKMSKGVPYFPDHNLHRR